MTNEERIRALLVNIKNWSWDVEPQFKVEKEDADALLEAYAGIYPWLGERNEQ